MTTHDFYEALPRISDFAELSRASAYTPLPKDWLVCCTDIVNSTALIEEGRYKTVNMVAASVIAAMINAMSGRAFPFVFGGDGVSFAVPPEDHDIAHHTLANLRSWIDREFGISLRAALLPVDWIRQEGLEVSVARYAVSAGADYAMFAGGGLAWSEQQMKAGGFEVLPAEHVMPPDLTGLSCRWQNMKSRNGVILSLLILPTPEGSDRAFSELAARILRLAATLDRSGHPIPKSGPTIGLPQGRFRDESRLVRQNRSALINRLRLMIQFILFMLVFWRGKKVLGFDPEHYRTTLSANADYRKFDDGLKMTLDSTPEVQSALRGLLEEARDSGLIQFGWHEQDEALMTCIVPSALRDDHVHFIDGASGGYTQAAKSLS
ncbi:Protein of unknown function [Epibacterium ulvae]|uniref:Uncharacterized protein n=1 Tax=Epibacterium ulvae TaxID=1156985 RepID=A0A1G5QWC9_9RHOB|nr:DUF3095 domain-containing protein [Epibacterium ulvae]SCZ66047.1 Protein of unknown function [Epibacterium ulvae]